MSNSDDYKDHLYNDTDKDKQLVCWIDDSDTKPAVRIIRDMASGRVYVQEWYNPDGRPHYWIESLGNENRVATKYADLIDKIALLSEIVLSTKP